MSQITTNIVLNGPNGGEDKIEVRFNLAAIDWYEQNSGSKLIWGLTNDMGLRSVVFFLQAGMRFRNSEISYEQVRDRIQSHIDNGGDIPGLMQQIAKALRLFGVLKREEGDSNPSTRALLSA